MSHTLTLNLDDGLKQALDRAMERTQQSAEVLVLQLLTQNLIGQEAPAVATPLELPDDPLLQLAGCITSDVGNVADRHDYYIGKAIYDEMHQDD